MLLDRLITSKCFAGEEAELIKAVREGIPCSAFSLSQSQKIHLASVLSQTNFLLFIAADFFSAQTAHKQLSMILGKENVAYISAKDDVLLPVRTGGERLVKRLTALYQITNYNVQITNKAGSAGIRAAVVDIEGLMHRFPSFERFADGIIDIKAGGEIPPEALAAVLIKNGYRREDAAEGRGRYSLRGGILDIFPIQSDRPVRLEFFGDTVESIRYYDPSTLLSGERVQSVSVAPATDVFGDEKVPSGNLADYLPPDTVIFFDETKQITDALNGQYGEFETRLKTLYQITNYNVQITNEAGQFINAVYKKEEVLSWTEKFRRLACHRVTTSNNIFKPAAVYGFKPPPPLRYHRDAAQLAKDIYAWTRTGYRVLLCGRDEAFCAQLRESLMECGASVPILKEPGNISRFPFPVSHLNAAGAYIIPQELESGFIWHGGKLAVVGTYDIISRPKTILARRRASDAFTEARVGDFAVHDTHGVGR